MRTLRSVKTNVRTATTAVTRATSRGEMLATVTKKTYMTIAPTTAIQSERMIRPTNPTTDQG